MYELINGTPMPVREYNGQRVVTFKDIDSVHQRPEGTAKRNFNTNSKHFIEGVDYFLVKPSDFRMDEFRPSEINNRGTMLITLSGYLMISKSFTDDLSWGVQRMLVTYFTAREQANDYSDLLRRQNELEKRLALLESKQTGRKKQKIRHENPQENAEYVLEKMCKSGETIFKKTTLFRMCRKLKAKELTEALEILAEMHIVSYQIINNGQKGKPAEIIEILNWRR